MIKLSQCPEIIQLKNVIKAETLIKNSHGEFTKAMDRDFLRIKEYLERYEVGNDMLVRISSEMHKATYMETLEEAAEVVSNLSSTFWD